MLVGAGWGDDKIWLVFMYRNVGVKFFYLRLIYIYRNTIYT